MSKAGDFFSKLGIDLDSIKPKGSEGRPIDPKVLAELTTNFKALTDAIDEGNDKIIAYKAGLATARIELAKATTTRTVKKYSQQIDDLNQALKSSQYSVKTSSDGLSNFIKEAGKIKNIDPTKLYQSLKGFEGFDQGLKGSAKELGHVGNLTKGFFSHFTEAAGASFTKMSSFLTTGLADPLTALIAIGEMAAAQILDLNDRLIEFQRSMNSSVGYRDIGYDAYGNSQVAGKASLAQNAGINGVSEDQILQTYSAFKESSGSIGSKDLQNNPKELQEYGIQVAKMNKMYGVSADVSSKVSKVLTTQYNKGIKESADIMEHGAIVAKNAGLNVGIFFDNLAAIADLKGQLFVKGGSEGLEKAALGLAKLGLGVEKLAKLQDSYTGFSDLIDKQQKAAALGLSNISAAQNKIFAQIQTGNTEGALETKQIAGAKDIQGQTTKDGKINQQGIQLLSAAGYDKEEIANIEKINQSAKKLGISVDQVVTKNNLTAAQQRKLNALDMEQLTIKEKLVKMWSSIKAVIIDPITTILGPILSIAIDTIVTAFDTLHKAFEPFIAGVQWVGKLLGSISGDGTIAKILGNILAVLIAWKGLSLAKNAFGALSGLVGGGSGAGGGILAGVGQLLGKTRLGGAIAGGMGGLNAAASVGTLGKASKLLGGGGGLVAAIGGQALGGLISMGAEKGSTREKVGDTVGSAASWAGTGAMLGTFFGPAGTLVGGIVGGLGGVIAENWDGIKDGFSKMGDTTKLMLGVLSPLTGAAIPFIESFWDKNKEANDVQVKIASLGGMNNSLPEISKIMENKKYNTSLQQQSEKENMVNNTVNHKPAPVVVHVINDAHGLSSLKARNSGR
ncbi:MAG: hypothetical protein ABIP51_18060 [Bacteroidia bacterium]